MRLKYILPVLFIILGLSIYSQQPVWSTTTFSGPNGGSVTVPIYMTQLVYLVNVSQNTSAQYIQFTVPEQILQQQLQYCKTYDPFITNNISVDECAFAYPNIVVVDTYSSGNYVMPNGNAYEIPYYMTVLSYDNVTGLPQTFQIYLNNHIGLLSSGTYYLYVYYPGPYYYTFGAVNTTYIPVCPGSSSVPAAIPYSGGWCNIAGSVGISSYSYWNSNAWGQELIYNANNNPLTRYLYVTFNPQDPVIIGYQLLYCFYCNTNGVVTVENPSTGATKVISFNDDTMYDLRTLEQQAGLNPYQWNEIVSIGINGGGGIGASGIILIYTPQT